MNLDEIRAILELMQEHDVAEFELEREGVKLRLRKTTTGTWAAHMPPLPQVTYAAPMPQTAPGTPGALGPPQQPSTVLSAAQEEEDVDLAIVKSPIVGTFYRSSEPGSKPFVEIGQTVRQGQVLCIIEAMKLMNEIAAECDGEIAKVYVENAHAVQYGERLFAIKPT
jgi:acetyl-CoA carboxylase biotin carboxyl carrier protein